MSEWDFQEQDAAGEDLNRQLSDHERMLQYFGLDESDWQFLSRGERSQMLWNWKKFGSKP